MGHLLHFISILQEASKTKQYTSEDFLALKKKMQAKGKMIGRVSD